MQRRKLSIECLLSNADHPSIAVITFNNRYLLIHGLLRRISRQYQQVALAFELTNSGHLFDEQLTAAVQKQD